MHRKNASPRLDWLIAQTGCVASLMGHNLPCLWVGPQPKRSALTHLERPTPRPVGYPYRHATAYRGCIVIHTLASRFSTLRPQAPHSPSSRISQMGQIARNISLGGTISDRGGDGSDALICVLMQGMYGDPPPCPSWTRRGRSSRSLGRLARQGYVRAKVLVQDNSKPCTCTTPQPPPSDP